MTTVTKAPLTPEEIIRQKREEMVAVASGLPEVISATAKIFARSSAWADEIGITAKPAKTTITPAAKNIAKVMDANYRTAFNAEQWGFLKEMLELGLGIEIPSTKVGVKASSTSIAKDGTALKLIASKHGHKYPLNVVIFVNNGEELKGFDSNGITPPTGFHFDPEPTSMQLPTETEILEGLGQLYIMNTALFTQIVEQASKS